MKAGTFYKVTRSDGFDCHTGTVNYRDAIGWELYIHDEGPPHLCSSSVLHASSTIAGAMRHSGAGAFFEVFGTPALLSTDKVKAGFTELTVVREIPREEALANLTGADLSGANLTEANLTETNFSGTNFSGADLSWANLTEADLSWANLTEAYLTGTNFSGADLPWANLTGANLTGTNLPLGPRSFRPGSQG